MSKESEIKMVLAMELWLVAKNQPATHVPHAAHDAASDLLALYKAALHPHTLTKFYDEWHAYMRDAYGNDAIVGAPTTTRFAGVIMGMTVKGRMFGTPRENAAFEIVYGDLTNHKPRPSFQIRLEAGELEWSGELPDDTNRAIGVVATKAHRTARNPSIPSEAEYLGETLGAPTLNPGGKHWYVFFWENLREKPKSYQGPFTLESSARTAMNQEIRKYGDADRSAYRIKHLTESEFTKIWGAPPVFSNPCHNPACPACGAHLAAGASSCPSCGIRVRAGAEGVATPLESPRHIVTRKGRPPGVPAGNPGAYVRVGRMPTDTELASAWRYIDAEFRFGPDDVVDGEQWAEGLAFGQYEGTAADRAAVAEMKPQLTEVQWRSIAYRADHLRADQGLAPKFKE